VHLPIRRALCRRSQRRKIACTGWFGQLNEHPGTKSTRRDQFAIDRIFGCTKSFSDVLISFFVPTPALHFLVKKIFALRLKIKFIFFLSVSQLISNLKPAGEGSHNPHVNNL
jgi:hypothetical protein